MSSHTWFINQYGKPCYGEKTADNRLTAKSHCAIIENDIGIDYYLRIGTCDQDGLVDEDLPHINANSSGYSVGR